MSSQEGNHVLNRKRSTTDSSEQLPHDHSDLGSSAKRLRTAAETSFQEVESHDDVRIRGIRRNEMPYYVLISIRPNLHTFTEWPTRCPEGQRADRHFFDFFCRYAVKSDII
jgi:hypothetical protein